MLIGFTGFLVNWFAGFSGMFDLNFKNTVVFWLVGALGVVLSLIMFIIVLAELISKYRQGPVVNDQAWPSGYGQIAFSIINILCGGYIISIIFVLYALSHVVQARYESEYDNAERQIKTAKKFNIIAAIITGIFILGYGIVIISAILIRIFSLRNR